MLIPKTLAYILTMLWVTNSMAAAETYGYPFDDPYIATVVGTPEQFRATLPTVIPTQHDAIKIFEDREPPAYLWYEDKLRYSYVLQNKPAPLIFLIAGTGSPYSSGNNEMMARAFYQAGFHIVSLSSPTVPNFVVSASKTSVVGHTVHDAEDLYNVMEVIWNKLQKEIEVTDFFITGYSLGGMNAAFVTWLDEQKQVFNFKKALLINPPVSLYNSISLLDRMLENVPGGVDNFPQYYDNMVSGFSQVYRRAERLEFDDDFLFQVFAAMEPKDEELAALIGLSFRFASAHLVIASDVSTNFGYIKPKNIVFTRNTNPSPYSDVAFRLGFTDYFHDYFYPFYKEQDNTLTRDDLIESMSLASIEDYLHNANKIEVIHNANDLILKKGEIDFFPRVFGDRAKIYPTGGHCGNMGYRDNVAHMVGVFTQ